MNQYQEFIFYRTYARYLPELGRRETFQESVYRYWKYLLDRVPKSKHWEYCQVYDTLLDRRVVPSMRAFWAAGPALDVDNAAAYNCAALPIDRVEAFSEMLYLLMNGCGVGFSVERQFINQLPIVPNLTGLSVEPIVVEDSKLGWAEGLARLLEYLYHGIIPPYDLSKVRPKGSPLKTFGGRASGPEPLDELFRFVIKVFSNTERGSRLNSEQVHDICCMIANCVVVGGVRRSATISLGNLSDDRHAKLKSGQWYYTAPYRATANNSVAYTEKPGSRKFLSEWMKLVESKSGERGIFNRQAAEKKVRSTGRRDGGYPWMLNPCGEIFLRPRQFCNLTEAIIYPHTDMHQAAVAVRHATVLGCLQATLTDFKFIGSDWTANSEEERLLGVSLTGLMDNPLFSAATPTVASRLRTLRGIARKTAKDWSAALGIPMPAAITTCKPSGTVSQLMGTSSGIHPRPSRYYLRRVRVTSSDPLAKLMISTGVPHQPETGQDPNNPSTWVFEFPVVSPKDAVLADHHGALKSLRYWQMMRDNWCEHNPSCTIYVKDHEWPRVGAWVYDHWDEIGGLSFFPAFDEETIYQLAPQEKLSKKDYHRLEGDMPRIDFSRLPEFENEDNTTGAREYACVGGNCEI